MGSKQSRTIQTWGRDWIVEELYLEHNGPIVLIDSRAIVFLVKCFSLDEWAPPISLRHKWPFISTEEHVRQSARIYPNSKSRWWQNPHQYCIISIQLLQRCSKLSPKDLTLSLKHAKRLPRHPSNTGSNLNRQSKTSTSTTAHARVR